MNGLSYDNLLIMEEAIEERKKEMEVELEQSNENHDNDVENSKAQQRASLRLEVNEKLGELKVRKKRQMLLSTVG